MASTAWFATVGSIIGLAALTTGPAWAATVQGGWSYAIDSFDDGVTGLQVGGGAFEFYGMAIREDATQVTVALNANLSLDGFANPAAEDGKINWGDLFFNFSGQDFGTANGNLFAVRFDGNNDSGVATTGLYSTVTAGSVTAINSGFSSLTKYNTKVIANGGTPSLGDLSATDPYLSQTDPVLNSIASGTKIGDIDLGADLSGLDFSSFGAVGTTTIGFSFDRILLPDGDFVAHVLAECANDGIALVSALNAGGTPGGGPGGPVPGPDPGTEPQISEEAPEPGMLMGLLAAGAIGVRGRRSREQSS